MYAALLILIRTSYVCSCILLFLKHTFKCFHCKNVFSDWHVYFFPLWFPAWVWMPAEMKDSGKWTRLWTVVCLQLSKWHVALPHTDIHANHNRNDRLAPPPHPPQQSCQHASPTDNKLPHPCACRQTGTNWDNPPPLPPSITTHSCSPLRAAAASAQGANSTFRSPFVLIMLT